MQTQGDQLTEEELQEQEHNEEFLTFELATEEYAVPIKQVQEIRAWEPVTRVPHAADYECGLINLRGAIVPIIDLRKRLGLKKQTYDRHTVVILFGIENKGRERTVGGVVDALSDVVRFPESDIQPSPEISKKKSTHLAGGVVEYKGRMIVMLDLLSAVSLDEAVAH